MRKNYPPLVCLEILGELLAILGNFFWELLDISEELLGNFDFEFLVYPDIP